MWTVVLPKKYLNVSKKFIYSFQDFNFMSTSRLITYFVQYEFSKQSEISNLDCMYCRTL